MKFWGLLFWGTVVCCRLAEAQQTTVKEENREMITYAFSDPNPVAQPENLFYPYFRFDGFAAKGEKKSWKTVDLENEYIRLTLFPEIGGKIWGATDKTSGKKFIYDNGVVKFRDIAMRGPWTSGGIEFNFGIIGHAPTSSTPVDYLVKEKEDGSVSCYIFSYDWITRTVWNVEVNLPADKAYFVTHTTWYNQSGLDQPYYQWMNAGYPVGSDAVFCYPGNHYIGHNGELFSFPKDEQGRDISTYAGNNFGNSKSYHILGHYNDYHGVYWQGEDFGSLHHAAYDEKLGMKIFLWGLSREGGIWEDLLTDADGQYIELQSGRVFNQPASGSTYTPYKHYSFAPQMTETWTEYWFPVKGIQGVSKAGRIGALRVYREKDSLRLAFSPTERLTTVVKLYNDAQLVKTLPLHANVLEVVRWSLPVTETAPQGKLRVVIGEDELVYSEQPVDYELSRPNQLPAGFDWNTVYGLYTQGEQWMNQKVWDKAEHYLKKALEKDAWFAPALVRLGSLYYREGRYDEALEAVRKALSLNTYDGEANYLYGLCNRMSGKNTDAKDGFSIASFAPQVRTAAYEQLGEMFALEGDWKKAEHYAWKSLEYNRNNLKSCQLLALAYRKMGQPEKAKAQIGKMLRDLPLYHFARFEKQCLDGTGKAGDFTALVRNELPFETYMEMAGWYESVGCTEEALQLLDLAGNYPIALYKKAYLLAGKNRTTALSLIEKANELSPEFVFPFRPETLKVLDWAASVAPHWKIDYYRSLIYRVGQNKTKALELLEKQEAKGFAPFYLTRAFLKKGKERLLDLQKAEQIEASWRVGLALVNYYAEQKQWPELVETGKRYLRDYPDNYYIGLKYAQALCEIGRYKDCISLLKKMHVLPNEGAYAGRAVYRSANLYRAMDLLAAKKYTQAIENVRASKEWPENLGVGKPYDSEIDDRLENYLEARACRGKGNQAKAQLLLEKVAGYAHTKRSFFESGNLLTALALKETGRDNEADLMVADWEKEYPESKIAQWCVAVYRGDKSKAEQLLATRQTQVDTTPWEAAGRDVNLELILRLF